MWADVTNLAKRNAFVKNYLARRDRLKQRFLAERMGEADLQQEAAKLFTPITKTVAERSAQQTGAISQIVKAQTGELAKIADKQTGELARRTNKQANELAQAIDALGRVLAIEGRAQARALEEARADEARATSPEGMFGTPPEPIMIDVDQGNY